MIDGQFPVGILGKKLERNLGLALPYHQMDNDKALEDNGPCRVAQTVGEGAEDFSDACFAGVCRNEDVFDIL